MTAQQILDDLGFIPWCLDEEVPVGTVLEEYYNDGIVPKGAKVVVVGSLSREEAFFIAHDRGWSEHSDYKYFYKVVAE